jgi:antitoxin component of MazEF toxin-antitoxin module
VDITFFFVERYFKTEIINYDILCVKKCISIEEGKSMEIVKDNVSFGRWGNSDAFRIPKKIYSYLGFNKEDKYEIRAEILPDGRKRMIIEEKPNFQQKIAMAESLGGILKDKIPNDMEAHDYRNMRHEERLAKYENLD